MNIQKRLQIEFEFLGDEQISAKTALKIINDVFKKAESSQLIIHSVSKFKRDETLELLEEIMIKVKEADSEVENGIYDPMLDCAKHILNNYKIERR